MFETILVLDGAARLWDRHVQRLTTGCVRPGIPEPDAAILREDCLRLTADMPNGVIKIIVTRGSGADGYRPPEHPSVTRIVSRRALPAGIDDRRRRGIAVYVCRSRLAVNPALAGLKHLNRLEQVLASREFDPAEFDEGLVLSSRGHLVEGTRTNLFVVSSGSLLTPPTGECGVGGVMRDFVVERARHLGMHTEEAAMTLDILDQAQEIFVTNSIVGIWPVTSVAGASLRRFDIGAVATRLIDDLRGLGELL